MTTARRSAGTAWLVLAVGAGLDVETVLAADVDWKPLVTVAERKRDSHGGLLPLQSYDETIRRGMGFLLDDHVTWFKGPPGTRPGSGS